MSVWFDFVNGLVSIRCLGGLINQILKLLTIDNISFKFAIFYLFKSNTLYVHLIVR